jgi:hypothetical protein
MEVRNFWDFALKYLFILFFLCVVEINIDDGTKFLEDKDKRAIVLNVLRILMCIILVHKIHICIFCIELLFCCMLFTQMVFTKEVLCK